MMRRTDLRRMGGDAGFTLVELIMAIAIIGVITVPLGDVVLGFLKNTDATTARLLESHDVQIASAYWAQDVASVGTRDPAYALTPYVESGVAYDSGLYPCGPEGTPIAIARLAWDDFDGAGEARVVRVAYFRQGTELHRLRCNGSSVKVSDVILAHNLDPNPDPLTPPMVTCTPACTTEPAMPTTVTLNLTLKGPNSGDAAYNVALTGQRRQSP